jgi:hypothetical protein
MKVGKSKHSSNKENIFKDKAIIVQFSITHNELRSYKENNITYLSIQKRKKTDNPKLGNKGTPRWRSGSTESYSPAFPRRIKHKLR